MQGLVRQKIFSEERDRPGIHRLNVVGKGCLGDVESRQISLCLDIRHRDRYSIESKYLIDHVVNQVHFIGLLTEVLVAGPGLREVDVKDCS